MRMKYTGKNVEVTAALRDATEKKLARLDKYFQKDLDGSVVFSTQKKRQIIEVTINLPGTIIRAEEATDDMYASVDKAIDVLERQVRKYKTRLQKRHKNTKEISFENVMPLAEEEDGEKLRLSKTKKFALKPMTTEEAIMQMELLSHDFFVYLDANTGEADVVYKRKDGDYGLLESESKA